MTGLKYYTVFACIVSFVVAVSISRCNICCNFIWCEIDAMQEQQHLKQFNCTIELLLQQLFRSVIYVDLQKQVSDIGQQLRYEFASSVSMCL